MQAAVGAMVATVLGSALYYSTDPDPSSSFESFEGIGKNHGMLLLVEKWNHYRHYDTELFDAVIDNIDALCFRWYSLTQLKTACDKYDGPESYMILIKIREQLADFIRIVSPQLIPKQAVQLQQVYDDLANANQELFIQIMKRCRNIDL